MTKLLYASKVLIKKTIPGPRAHFSGGITGIVNIIADNDNFGLIELDKKGVPINEIAWYHKEDIELIDNRNRPANKEIIKMYKKQPEWLKKYIKKHFDNKNENKYIVRGGERNKYQFKTNDTTLPYIKTTITHILLWIGIFFVITTIFLLFNL